MVGEPIEFAASQLDASAAAYDPAKWRAPLVVGHPKTNAPAYGWVDKLASSSLGLEAEPADVEPAFAEMVNAKRFANISASFWAPDAPGNPVPGVYYLRHVGFLGAVPPAIKGLRTPEFAEAENGVVEFSEWDVDNAGLWRRMREWVIAKFGLTDADQVVPSYLVDGLERSAQRELDESLSEDPSTAAPLAPAFSDPAQQETSVTPEEKAALEAENAKLRAQLAASAHATAHAAHVSFAEGLSVAGRLPPAHTGMVVAVLDHLATQPAVVEFGEGEEKGPVADAFRTFLEALPVAAEFSEEVATTARAASGAPGVIEFAAPRGMEVDGGSAQLHAKALAYQKAHPDTDYITAIQAVS